MLSLYEGRSHMLQFVSWASRIISSIKLEIMMMIISMTGTAHTSLTSDNYRAPLLSSSGLIKHSLAPPS